MHLLGLQAGVNTVRNQPRLIQTRRTCSCRTKDASFRFQRHGAFDHFQTATHVEVFAHLFGCCLLLILNFYQQLSVYGSAACEIPAPTAYSRSRVQITGVNRTSTGQCMSRVNPDVLLAWCEAPSHFLPPGLPAAPAQHSQSAGAPYHAGARQAGAVLQLQHVHRWVCCVHDWRHLVTILIVTQCRGFTAAPSVQPSRDQPAECGPPAQGVLRGERLHLCAAHTHPHRPVT